MLQELATFGSACWILQQGRMDRRLWLTTLPTQGHDRLAKSGVCRSELSRLAALAPAIFPRILIMNLNTLLRGKKK